MQISASKICNFNFKFEHQKLRQRIVRWLLAISLRCPRKANRKFIRQILLNTINKPKLAIIS